MVEDQNIEPRKLREIKTFEIFSDIFGHDFVLKIVFARLEDVCRAPKVKTTRAKSYVSLSTLASKTQAALRNYAFKCVPQMQHQVERVVSGAKCAPEPKGLNSQRRA
jgi:hypothetical protein